MATQDKDAVGSKEEAVRMFDRSTIPNVMTMVRVLLEVVLFIVAWGVISTYERDHVVSYDADNRLYYTEKVMTSDAWNKTYTDRLKIDNNATLLSLSLAGYSTLFSCSKIPLHEMCVCMNACTKTDHIQTCLLQKNTPIVLKPNNGTNFLAMVILWFGFTAASSTIALGYTYRLNQAMMEVRDPKTAKKFYYDFGRMLAIVGALLWLVVFISGLYYGYRDPSFSFLFFVWLVFSIFTLIIAYYGEMYELGMIILGNVPDPTHIPERNTKVADRFSRERIMKALTTDIEYIKTANNHFHNTAMKQFLFYGNLLFCVPAIASVLHVMHHWYDVNQILNTVYLLMTIVVIDGFSVHLSSTWESNTKRLMSHSHIVQVGTLKMFAWFVNGLILYLLFTINYPTVVDEATLAYGMFAIALLYFSITFLIPDLVREFTDVYTVHALAIRVWGSFVFRVLALTYICFHIKYHIEKNVPLVVAK
jgi:hypothetical protein